ncbi:M13 family metallopeptidase [Nitrospirillum sp. BR 11164]|uniref:M13 family metallopeptidase n=1 Tax=Nitrospirillum sp. BR 11164 TaxID=3104324 RepID=UPI002AFF2128|nr:M13 family metallopeptidase [Nitrospirillum sp. BR 11164]MEA1651304.1 M13 family metallopeptidase [Nitrospirillum sp. BR 11164]
MRLPVLVLCLLMAMPAAAVARPSPWPGGAPEVDPGQDFFRHANGGWLDEVAIAPDRPGYSTATQLTETAEARVHELLEAAAQAGAPADGETAQVGAYYAAFMDEARAQSLGGRPLHADLMRLRLAATRTALAEVMGQATASLHGSWFQLSVDRDSRDASRHALYLGQGGLGGLDRAFYTEAGNAPRRAAYRAYIARLLTLAGWPQADSRAEDILALETKIATASWTPAQQRDERAIYNPMTPAQLARGAPGFPWADYLAAAGLGGADRIVVVERTAVPALAHLFAVTPLPVLRAWAAFHLVDNAAPFLAKEYADAWFDLHGRTVEGKQAPPPRWRQALAQVSGGGWKDMAHSRGALGDAVGRLYTARWFDRQAQATLAALVDRLKATVKTRIAASAWMSGQAKAEATRKVDAYRVLIGAPATGDRYDGLVMRRDDLYGDVVRATAFAWARDRRRLALPVDPQAWAITPQTVNAYNDGAALTVVFTAALLQPPAFDAKADLAVIYGGIGAIIGHELTHAFDDQGRLFDAAGHARDWWTKADTARFTALADRLVGLYGACQVAPGLTVDGRLTLGENLADVGGLQLAFEAYHAALAEGEAPVVNGLTGDQRFFLAFAQLRRGKRRPEALRNDVANDPHTPDGCRVNQAVRNVDGWYQAFGVGPGAPLYLRPEDRVRIW